MKEELLLAKRILKDPNLSHYATRKFAETIEKRNDRKLMLGEADVRDLIEK